MKQIKIELLDSMGNDEGIAHSAWTSSLDLQKKALKGPEDISRVVNMLADLRHSVPFESVIFKFWIRVPISTDRQIMTHRIASQSGMSGRYRTMPSDFIETPKDVYEIYRKLHDSEAVMFVEEYNRLAKKANEFYINELKAMKVAKESKTITDDEYKRVREFVRNILPQGNMTERVTVMNLRSFANFYSLRSKKDAQPEIQQVAELMLRVIRNRKICPIAIKALERNQWKI